MERKRKKRIYLFCCILLTFLIIFSFLKKISSPKTTIINNDISMEENITIENEIQEEKIELEKITVYTTTTVHIRAVAALDSQIISTIGVNTELIKIGEEGDWSKIIWEDQERYIFSKYVSTEKTIIKKQEKIQSAAIPKNVYQEYAYSLFTQYGWSDNDFQCLVKLWEKESKWNPNAKNKSSGAYGIPQALPGSKMVSEGADWRTNYKTQIRWGLKYIKQRYGTPTAAWNSFLKKGWY